jgi:hypothetical protein
VKLANAVVAASGRRVDWIHLPVLDRSDDAFLAPLKDLNPQGARVYLGAIHNMARFKERIATARKYLPNFVARLRRWVIGGRRRRTVPGLPHRRV